MRCRTPLGDRPDDERLAATGVAGDEHTGHVGHVGVVAGGVGARVALDAELVEQLALRAEEAHREQHELRRDLPLGALDLLEAALAHDDLVQPQRRPPGPRSSPTISLVDTAYTRSPPSSCARGDAEGHRVGRPRLVRGALGRRAAA